MSALASFSVHANTEETLDATFYSDGSCYVEIGQRSETGKTIIDADVDELGSRMLLHCDVGDGSKLTLLVRGNTLNVAQRAPFLSKAQMDDGKVGMIAWFTPRMTEGLDGNTSKRYVSTGSVIMRKSPPVVIDDGTLPSQRQSFARLTGWLEPTGR